MYDLVLFVYYFSQYYMISNIGQFQSVGFQCMREQPYDFIVIGCFEVANFKRWCIMLLGSWHTTICISNRF